MWHLWLIFHPSHSSHTPTASSLGLVPWSSCPVVFFTLLRVMFLAVLRCRWPTKVVEEGLLPFVKMLDDLILYFAIHDCTNNGPWIPRVVFTMFIGLDIHISECYGYTFSVEKSSWDACELHETWSPWGVVGGVFMPSFIPYTHRALTCGSLGTPK